MPKHARKKKPKRLYERPVAIKMDRDSIELFIKGGKGKNMFFRNLKKNVVSLLREKKVGDILQDIRGRKQKVQQAGEWMNEKLEQLLQLELEENPRARELRTLLKDKAIELESERYTAELLVSALERGLSGNLSDKQLDGLLDRRKTIVEHMIGLEKKDLTRFGSERMLSTVNKRWACSNENVNRILLLYERISLIERNLSAGR